MPEIKRDPHRMDCTGIDLVHATDRMPPGAFPFLMNARVIQEGRIDARPGYTLFSNITHDPNLLHSFRIMNDVDSVYNVAGAIQIAGNSTGLYAAGSLIDTGYSGFPLSLLTFRPENSSTAWMYVYDANKQVKVRSDGALRTIGLAPPVTPPSVNYGQPAYAPIFDPVVGRGWVTNGNVIVPTVTDRTMASTPTIHYILYDEGFSGWCCINPIVSAFTFSWAGERMQVNINGESVVIREIHEAIPVCLVESIVYQSGTTGMCSLVITGSPSNLERNSLIMIGSEVVRVLAVILSADGSTYSVRCSTVDHHVVGETIVGLYSWYVWTSIEHFTTEAISVSYMLSSAAEATGTVDTVGTTVNFASGQQFNVTWPTGPSPGFPGATTILIGTQTWTIASVVSATQLIVNAVTVGGVVTTPGTHSGTAFSVITAALSGSLDLLYAVNSGTVDTSALDVTWVSGPKFTDWPTGTRIDIDGTPYKISFVVSETALVLQSTAGTLSGVSWDVPFVNAQQTGGGTGRPITIADDYIHFSVFLEHPQSVAYIIFSIDIDPGTSTVGPSGNAFTGNYWTWTIPGPQLTNASSSTIGNSWIEIVIPISSGVRSGYNLALNFSRITALRVKIVTTQPTGFGWDNWYFFGTYGPTVLPNAPTGYLYETVNRDSSTGAASVPGPFTDYEIRPLREQVLVTPTYSTIAGVDQIDLYRQGGLLDNFAYIGTEFNFSPIGTFPDIATDTIVAANPAPDLTLIQPWPILQLPWSGLVSTAGNIATWEKGSPWDANLLSESVITINGVAYLTRSQPHTTTAGTGVVDVNDVSVAWVSGDKFDLTWPVNAIIIINGVARRIAAVSTTQALTLTETAGGLQLGLNYSVPYTSWVELTFSAGTLSMVPFVVNSPTIAAQPLPFAFGPLEGPFAPVIFALGDLVNAGTLYYTNSSNADGASDQNTLELCTPSEPLVSGDVWNGMAFAGSHDNLYTVRYSYLTTVTVASGGPSTFQWSRIPAASGIWSRWACTRGPDGVYYLGRDGIYRVTDQGAVNLTDAFLYPLFPHDGQPASGANGLNAVDMTRIADLRLVRGDSAMLFFYTDITGQAMCLRYEYTRKRWFPHQFADGMASAYLVEESETTPSREQLLYLARNGGNVFLAGGDTDNGADINTSVRTPFFDGGDERGQKLIVDIIHESDQFGHLTAGLTFNDGENTFPDFIISAGATRSQSIQDVGQLSYLRLWRNISVLYTWKGGPSGPRIYGFEPAAYAQPYMSTIIVTQFIALGYPGWKHHRRLYAGLISNAQLLFTIKTQDGRTYTANVPSTGGQFKIFPVMLPQNVKDLAFAYQLTGGLFALFPESFTIETKEWKQPEYVLLPIFST